MDNKEKSLAGQVKDIGFLGELWQQIRLVYYLIRDKDVPIYLKLLPLLGIGYILFPIDFAPDFIPVLGQLDDLTLLIIGAKVFIEMAPPEIVARYSAQMRAATSAKTAEGTGTEEGTRATTHVIEGELVEETESLKQDEVNGTGRRFRRQGK